MANGDSFLLKIHRIPAQSTHLAAAQAISCGQLDQGFQYVPLKEIQKLSKLFSGLDHPFGFMLFLRQYHPVGRVTVDNVKLQRILQALVDVGVVLAYRSR